MSGNPGARHRQLLVLDQFLRSGRRVQCRDSPCSRQWEADPPLSQLIVSAHSRWFPEQEPLHSETHDLGTGAQLCPCRRTVHFSRPNKTCHTSHLTRVSTSFTLRCVEIRGAAPIPRPHGRLKGRKQVGCHHGRPETAILYGSIVLASSGAGRKEDSLWSLRSLPVTV